MKLVLSTEALHPPLTGIGWYVHELASRLQQRETITQLRHCDGKSVTDPRSPENRSTSGQKTPGLENQKPRLPNLPFRPLAVKAAGKLYRARCSVQLNKLTDWVCHAPNYVLPRSAVREKNVVSVHDLSIYRYPHLHPRDRVNFMEHYLPRSVANAARIIVASQAIAAEVVEHFGVDEQIVRVIPFGVRSVFLSDKVLAENEQRRRLPQPLGNSPYLLFVNGADPRKNLADTLKAFELFAAKNSTENWKLAVTGDSSRLTEASIQDNVVRLGYPDESALALLYREAQGLCYPSKYEGFGMPVIEALASGTPVLTSRTPTLMEFSGLPGVVTPAEDSVAGLLEGLQRLVSSSMRDEARSNKLKAREKFSWQQCVDQTLACYSELA